MIVDDEGAAKKNGKKLGPTRNSGLEQFVEVAWRENEHR